MHVKSLAAAFALVTSSRAHLLSLEAGVVTKLLNLSWLPGGRRLLLLLLGFWCAGAIALDLISDLAAPSAKLNCDYGINFFVSGRLVAEGLAGKLYPPSPNLSFRDWPYNQEAHRLLPGLPEGTVAGFMYSPLVACLCAPLSLLGRIWSRVVWDLTNLLALLWCARRTARHCNVHFFPVFSGFLAFLPVFANLWVGQSALLFGALPLAGGLFCLLSRSPFRAGAALSAMILKPHYFLAALFTALLSRQRRCLFGLLAGAAFILAMSIACTGPSAFTGWLGSFKYSEETLTGSAYIVREPLIASLPGVILLMLPAVARADLKWLIYLGGLIPVIAVFLWAVRLSGKAPTETTRLAMIALFAGFAEVAGSPHLLLYDLSLLSLPGALLWLDGHINLPVKRCLLAGWLALNAYVAAVVLCQPPPAGLMLILLAVLAALVITGLRTGVAVAGEPASSRR